MSSSSVPQGYESDAVNTLRDKERLTVGDRFRKQRADFNTEAYDRVVDNPFLRASQNPLSTFSIDVDTAAYANLRRFLSSGAPPPKDVVRIEEMVNYFAYSYAGPKNSDPFSTQVEIASAPWKPEHRLVKVGLKGREIAQDKRPPSNLVFLIDVSGSMQPPNKLPLIKSAPADAAKTIKTEQKAWLAERNACGADMQCIMGNYRMRLQRFGEWRDQISGAAPTAETPVADPNAPTIDPNAPTIGPAAPPDAAPEGDPTGDPD